MNLKIGLLSAQLGLKREERNPDFEREVFCFECWKNRRLDCLRD